MFEDDEKFMIVYDMYLGGELLDELATIGPFQEEDAALLMNHLLGCISYCHQSNVVHRDIKPGTFLLHFYFALCTLHSVISIAF
jgi:serine/threonine protein kinase